MAAHFRGLLFMLPPNRRRLPCPQRHMPGHALQPAGHGIAPAEFPRLLGQGQEHRLRGILSPVGVAQHPPAYSEHQPAVPCDDLRERLLRACAHKLTKHRPVA